MDWIPNVLLLGPGGIKGLLEVSAIMAIEDLQPSWMENLNVIGGVSVGAYIALELCAGYTSKDILLDGLLVNLFRDICNLSLKDVIQNQGILSNQPIRERLSTRLSDRFGFVPTMHQLYMITGIEFMAVTVGHKTGVRYLNYQTEPNLSVVDAVMRSINIPFLFEKLSVDDIYIDGAFGNPYPVDQYDNGINNILGIIIESIPSEEEGVGDIQPIFKYLFESLNSSIRALRTNLIAKASNRCRHLILRWAATYDPLGMRIDEVTKAQMIVHGYSEARKFISREFIPAGIRKEKQE